MLDPDQWITRYSDYLFSIAILKTRSKETAQDLVQETFLSAYKALDTFKGNSSEKTWLTAILHNKIIDYYRKKDLLRDASGYLNDSDESFSATFFEDDARRKGHWKREAFPDVWEKDASDAIQRKEFFAVLQACIAKLPVKLVPVFIAKVMDEENADVICKELNITSSNYWVMLHRAKVLMRSCLETNWFKN
jgi:RNA polymerase sigma-70 factor (TIGR02943 family)